MEFEKSYRTCRAQSKIEEDCYDWWKRHALKQQQVSSGKYDLIFIGDSITHFWHDELNFEFGNETVWQEFYGKRSALNLGFGFDRPQNVLYRLEHGEFAGQEPKAVVLNIGTNCFSETERYDGDTPEAAFAGIRCVVEKIFELAPRTRLILMEIFPRLPQERQMKIDAVNELLREYAASDERIKVVSLYNQLSENGVIKKEFYSDGKTHLNAMGYRVWAEAIEPYIKEVLNEDFKKSKNKKLLNKYRKIFFVFALSAVVGMLCFMFLCAVNFAVNKCGERVFEDVEELPSCYTALVLGCAEKTKNRPNLYFKSRIETAVKLYRSGKVKTLLLSGDNGRKNYNEPELMRRALINAGVPDEKIYCDYAGFRTLDSVRRAEKVFGQKKIIVVSQKFHCERTIFLARRFGIEAWGYAAGENFPGRWRYRNRLREFFARGAAVADLLIGRQPKFYGEPVDMTVPQCKAD